MQTERLILNLELFGDVLAAIARHSEDREDRPANSCRNLNLFQLFLLFNFYLFTDKAVASSSVRRPNTQCAGSEDFGSASLHSATC